MKLWKAKDFYINELRKKDNKVLFNKPPVRPYYYFNTIINGTAYAIPLSSPKESVRINKFTQIIISDGVDDLGRLFLINMIPFNEKLFDKINFDDFDVQYKNLLAKQERFFVSNSSKILRKAETLYNARYNEKHYKYKMLSNHCVDFKVLESVCQKLALSTDIKEDTNELSNNTPTRKIKF